MTLNFMLASELNLHLGSGDITWRKGDRKNPVIDVAQKTVFLSLPSIAH